MLTIDSFSGEYKYLSNFFPAAVKMDGLTYPTVEHAYQAAKTFDEKVRKEIQTCGKASRAKTLGKRIRPLRPDWEKVKLSVMDDLLHKKFDAHPDLKRLLISTDTATIEEGNNWGDTFWGTCEGSGHNWLGVLLMKLRDEYLEGDIE